LDGSQDLRVTTWETRAYPFIASRKAEVNRQASKGGELIVNSAGEK